MQAQHIPNGGNQECPDIVRSLLVHSRQGLTSRTTGSRQMPPDVSGDSEPASHEADPSVARFRQFTMHRGSRSLLRNGISVEVGSRAFDILDVLFKSRGAVVSKSELFKQVWPSMIVEESNLRFQMACLRKALGDDRDMIKTITGRGYLLSTDHLDSTQATIDAQSMQGTLWRLESSPTSSDSSLNHEAPTVVRIDDDRAIRENLQRLLSSVQLSVEALLSYQNSRGSGASHLPACVVLDAWPPRERGRDFQSESVRTGLQVSVLLLGGYCHSPMSVRATKAVEPVTESALVA